MTDGRRKDGRTGFAASAEGAVSVIFALVLVPLLLSAGAAIDYSRAADARATLNAAADAAALSAVTSSALPLPPGQARQRALDVFNARVAGTPFVGRVRPRVQVDDADRRRTATVSYEADVATTIMQIARIATMTVGGSATAASNPPVFIDFHVLLDNSPSMGVGATPADIATMVNNTPDRCAFACHDLSAGGNDYYALAKRLGVTMRIDVVRQATQRLMDTAAATATVAGQFRTALYTFGTSCRQVALTAVSALTSNLSNARDEAGRIDLMTIPFQNFNDDQCTDYDGVLGALATALPISGDGSTPGQPQRVVLFVSDGVADANYPMTCSRPTTGGRCQEPIKPAVCQALRDRGIRVAVLYTTYLPLPTNSWYNTWIAPFETTIGTRMRDCASPGFFFEVSPSQGIAEAMEALFRRAVAQARLSR